MTNEQPPKKSFVIIGSKGAMNLLTDILGIGKQVQKLQNVTIEDNRSVSGAPRYDPRHRPGRFWTIQN